MARCSPTRAIWTAIARCCLAGTTPPSPAEPTSPPPRPNARRAMPSSPCGRTCANARSGWKNSTRCATASPPSWPTRRCTKNRTPARPPYGTRSIPRSWTGSTVRKRFGWPPLNDWKRPGADAMDPTFLITAFVTLFVIIDPVGMTPLFVALRACITAALILIVFAAFGEAVLGFVGISMPAFRIAGGILLFLTALDMLFERRTKRREDQAAQADDPSVFPLATPLIAGPGALATMILLTGQAPGDWGWIAAVHGVMLAVMAVTFLFFLAAGIIERALGPTGINVVTRLLGMLLAALSVQFVLDGLRAFGLAPA